jgi:hypothetical protein
MESLKTQFINLDVNVRTELAKLEATELEKANALITKKETQIKELLKKELSFFEYIGLKWYMKLAKKYSSFINIVQTNATDIVKSSSITIKIKNTTYTIDL